MAVKVIYELTLWLLAFVAFPKFLYALLFQKKYRSNFLKRLGVGFPEIESGERELIWIHAVSVGEAKAVSALAKRFKGMSGNPLVIISSTTETGHAEAKRSIPEADHHIFLPFDFYWLMAPLIKRIRPDRVILCETDFWYNFLRLSKKYGAQVALVNGKMSECSVDRFKRFSWLTRPLFSLFDIFCLQNQQYADRFASLGIPPEKMVVTGNLKFDSVPKLMTQEEKAAFRKQLGIEQNDKVLVIGSSHEPEEKLLLGAIQEILREEPDLKVILVPRHPERFNAVEAILQSFSIPYFRYSKPRLSSGSCPIILLDTMGLLGKCYQIATVAIVAGSYTPLVGGHNIIEPLWFGVPTLYGPNMHEQVELVDITSFYRAALQVPVESLLETVKVLLKNGEEAACLRDGSQKLVAAMQGATARTLEVL